VIKKFSIKSENEVQYLDDESDPTSDELHDALESLYDEFKKLGLKYSLLKYNYAYLFAGKRNSRK
jgi:hypothetical protein